MYLSLNFGVLQQQ